MPEGHSTPKRNRSAYDAARYERMKADPERHQQYLDSKRRERKARQDAKQSETERKRKWRAANREKDRALHAAHYAVEKAIAKGELVRPETCELCGAGGKIEAHHYKGYAPEFWLVVMWLCQMCHSKQHFPETEQGTMVPQKERQILCS